MTLPALSHDDLQFIVEFVAACRRADDDGALEALLAALRARTAATSLSATACGTDDGCAPQRIATPEASADGIRSCQGDERASACFQLLAPTDAHLRALLAHVLPHLLDAVLRLAPRRTPTLPRLTAREEEVLRWLAEGKSNWAIGQILGIAEGTVKYHLAKLFEKLGVTTRAQAAAIAVVRFNERAP